MSTVLAAQLAKISAKSSNPLDLKAQKKAHSKSLLFDPEVAASQDFDTIYQLCLEGYEELCQIDKRFIPFSRTLFSEQSKREERLQMTSMQNQELDQVLESFLSLVGARILLRPAIKAVEWLVRRFRVHEHNQLCLVLTFLPYHTTPLFATLLSILPKTLEPLLKFLHPYIESVATPPRHAIVYTATHNLNFFAAVNKYILKACLLGHHYAALLSFWATLAAEAIAGIIDQSVSGRQEVQRRNQEDVLLRILPFLNEGLSMRQVPDMRVGCYMIVTVIASKMDLDDKALTATMEAVVSNWTANTTHAGMICLTVLAQRRLALKLPKKVLKAVMSIQGVENDLLVLSRQYQVSKLTAGLILGTLDRLHKEEVTSCLTFIRTAIEGRLMNSGHLSLVINKILAAADHEEAAQKDEQDIQGQLADLILRLVDSEVVGVLVQEIISDTKIDTDKLEAKLQMVFRPRNDIHIPKPQDMAMADAREELQEESFESIAKHIPTRTAYEISFLSHSKSYVFGSLTEAFLVASSSVLDLTTFSDLPVLRKELIMSEPLFVSFFIRYWCGPHSSSSRAAAITCVHESLPNVRTSNDVQILIPYVLYALADPNEKVRYAATELIIKLKDIYSQKETEEENLTTRTILGEDSIYGSADETKAISWLSVDVASKFVRDVLVPSLEEFRQDEKYIARLLVHSLNATDGSKHSRSPKKALKKEIRAVILTSLCSHVVNTPLNSVKLRLLQMLNEIEKIGSISKSKLLVPLLLGVENRGDLELKNLCDQEHVDVSRLMDECVKIVAPNDRDGVQTLQRISLMSGSHSSIILQKAAAQRLRSMWPFLKSDIQMSLATALLDIAVNPPANNSNRGSQGDAMDMLRTIHLSVDILQSFIDRLPTISSNSDNSPSSVKRRRTSNGHVDSQHESSHHATQQGLRQTTIVLELVEGSKEGSDLQLMKGLFKVLGNLQHSKNELGIESGYLQSLALGSLHTVVERARTSPRVHVERSAVRADLVIDCFTTTSSPQVQQAALLLMSSLAGVVPELIIHSVMPVFTFMGTSLLRLSDDYSAHVVDQTIASVIPPLVQALRKQKGGALPGASELLLSFAAAFEHIPVHRRKALFSSLIEKLGPEEYLFALLVLLRDRYADNKRIVGFIQDFIGRYDALILLKTLEKYLDVIIDSLKPKATISSYFLTFSDGRTRPSIALNLLSLPPQIFRTQRLLSKSARVLAKKDKEADQLRLIYSRLVEQTLLLADQVQPYATLPGACDQMLDALLSLLSLEESIASLDTLLKRGNDHIRRQVLKSLEHRIHTENSGNHAAQRACLDFLPELTNVVESSSDLLLKHKTVSCIDRIVEKYGKKDIDRVAGVMKVISTDKCLAADDPKLRVISLLCLATSVEILRDAVVPIIPQALPIAMDHIAATLQQEQPDERLHNAVFSFVGALLIYIPWIITGRYLDRILTISYGSANASLSSGCNESRKDAMGLIAKKSDPHECFAALFRSWHSAMSEGVEAVSEHLDMLRLTIEHHPKSMIAKQSNTLLPLFLEVFDLRRIQCTPRTDETYEDHEIDQVERSVNNVIIKMIYKLSDVAFRPLFSTMLDWATASGNKQEQQGKIYRQITWYSFLATFFDTLQSIVTSYASFVIEDAVEVLCTITLDDHNSTTLWTRLVAALHSSFEHDQDDFWQSPSHFSTISVPLIDQLTKASSLPSSDALTSCITELAVAAELPDHHKSLNAAILPHMRSDNGAVRLAAIQCEMSLTQKLGEEWLSLLPEMLPFISELQEDDDEKVEREVGRWILMIEGILGESLDSMLL
ncbi:snoRNA-binding rRNA-processing protein utp10 [Lambiella insularis]|nr:snoRNA-binding rRNA-processing protein utp10 [Lambiella insularis]